MSGPGSSARLAHLYAPLPERVGRFARRRPHRPMPIADPLAGLTLENNEVWSYYDKGGQRVLADWPRPNWPIRAHGLYRIWPKFDRSRTPMRIRGIGSRQVSPRSWSRSGTREKARRPSANSGNPAVCDCGWCLGGVSASAIDMARHMMPRFRAACGAWVSGRALSEDPVPHGS